MAEAHIDRHRGVNSESMRRHNLSVVLRTVCQEGGTTRSELARRSGLTRSTILHLVNQLVEFGLVSEGVQTDRGKVGRPSARVEPNPRLVALAINPEVAYTTVTAVGLDRKIKGVAQVANTAGTSAPALMANSLAGARQLAEELSPESIVVAAGVAVPGLVRASDSVVTWAPHLRWDDVSFARPLEQALGVPTVIDNAANLGALAEHLFGSGRGYAHMVYVNGGPNGIGSGVLYSGRRLQGAVGYAGEIGHTVVNPTGKQCICGSVGCLESEVRWEDLERRLHSGPASPDELEHLFLATTDRYFLELAQRQIGYLGIALGNIINTLNPQLVVLGGFLRLFVLRYAELLTAKIEDHAISVNLDELVVSPSILGNHALAVGTAFHAFNSLLADPQPVGGRPSHDLTRNLR